MMSPITQREPKTVIKQISEFEEASKRLDKSIHDSGQLQYFVHLGTSGRRNQLTETATEDTVITKKLDKISVNAIHKQRDLAQRLKVLEIRHNRIFGKSLARDLTNNQSSLDIDSCEPHKVKATEPDLAPDCESVQASKSNFD